MSQFRFCPRCGNELEPAANDSGAQCGNCGKTWYHNAAPTAGCVIVRDGKALITRRAREPDKGRFDIPGGFLDHDEDPVSAVQREVDEELGMKVDVGYEDLIQAVPHEYGNDADWVLAIGFIATDASGEPEPADDVAEVRWIAADELDEIDFAWEHDRELVRKALRSS